MPGLQKKTRVAPLAIALTLFITVSCAAGGSNESYNNGNRGDGVSTGQTAPMQQTAPPDAEPPAGSGARAIQEAFRRVSRDVLPVVVEINVVQTVTQSGGSPLSELFGNPDGGNQQEFQRPGLGSGVIMRRNGNEVYVVTNAHVVRNADQIQVVLYDEREFSADFVGGDPRTDLAVVKFTSSTDIPIAEFGDASSMYIGDWVLAIGNPFGFESTVTAGIISAVSRRPGPGQPVSSYTDFIQTDAAINPGNSGGALVNLDGQVVGINTWIASQSGSSAGIGFAVPAGVVERVTDDIIDHGRVIYGWLGVGIQDVDPAILPGVRSSLDLGNQEGALIVNVHQASPAEGKLQPGDLVTRINGNDVTDATTLTRAVGELSPGTTTTFEVTRFGEEMSFEIGLAERAPEEEVQTASNLWPGAVAVALVEEVREQLGTPNELSGVLLIGVIADSPFANAGLQNGDLVSSIGGESIESPADFYRAITDGSFRYTFTVFRRGRQGEVTVQRP